MQLDGHIADRAACCSLAIVRFSRAGRSCDRGMRALRAACDMAMMQLRLAVVTMHYEPLAITAWPTALNGVPIRDWLTNANAFGYERLILITN
jgi:hypothetical protein